MNLIIRFLKVLISSLLRSPMGLLDNSTLRFRVLPTDLDINLHMNNARYLSFMDLGRTDLLLRAGMLGVVRRERWKPVVGNIDIKFRRPLMPFQSFEVHTRLLCWDEKWLYLEQCLESASGVHAIATVRGLFVSRNGSVPSRVVLNRLGHRDESPPFPTQVRCMLAWEEAGKG
jgi:YbgC/YbaW family acyl-CoA thioester hydrolase